MNTTEWSTWIFEVRDETKQEQIVFRHDADVVHPAPWTPW